MLKLSMSAVTKQSKGSTKGRLSIMYGGLVVHIRYIGLCAAWEMINYETYKYVRVSVCQNDGVFTTDIKNLQIGFLERYLNKTSKNYRTFSSSGLK